MYRPLCFRTPSPPLRSVITALSNNHVPFKRRMSTKSSGHEQSSFPTLTHFDHKTGRAQMVDVGSKSDTLRVAQASGRIYIPEVAYKLITSDDSLSNPEITENLAKAKEKVRRKGDVLAVAQLAGIMACKRTSDLIPLCHPLPLSHIEVVLAPGLNDDSNGDSDHRYSILCRAIVSCEGKTGVEMEALTAVSVALLTVWDMLKAVAGKEMLIGDIIVESKSGGKSDFQRPFSNNFQA